MKNHKRYERSGASMLVLVCATCFIVLLYITSFPGSATSFASDPAAGHLFLPRIDGATGAATITPTPAPAPAHPFVENFDGAPSSPRPWNPDDWDITVTSRDRDTWYTLEAMDAMHGPGCEPPPATHVISAYEDAVYQCQDHMMTAISASGYGAIYLTPPYLVDFSQGEAVIRVDVSTLRTSGRDWWDIWITPYEDNLTVPLEDWLPAQSGEPRRGIKVRMDHFNDQTVFKVYTISNHNALELDGDWWTGYESFLEPDARRRDTFEFRISRTHIKFGMPDYNFFWVDTGLSGLDWNQGIVTIAHHSYNPTKDGGLPNTWHWDNLSINPAVPFTIVNSDRRYANPDNPHLEFDAPAPPNGHLRFTGIGENLEVSFDGGTSWQMAQLQAQERYHEHHFRSYWMPFPQGATSVTFRAQGLWSDDWLVTDATIWAR